MHYLGGQIGSHHSYMIIANIPNDSIVVFLPGKASSNFVPNCWGFEIRLLIHPAVLKTDKFDPYQII